MAGKQRPKIEPLGKVPGAFKPLADKLNEVIEALNCMRPIQGDGLSITETDNGTRYDLAVNISATCNEDSTITIELESKS